MKKYIFYFLLSSVSLLSIISCSDDFYAKEPLGVTSETQLNTEKGAQQLLIAAYSLVDGVGATASGGRGQQWFGAGSNWLHGDLRSDDAYKGSIASDSPGMNDFELFTVLPTNDYLDPKWYTLYDGVSRSNDVLGAVENASDVNESTALLINAEARFLRAHYHFDAKKNWNSVPFIPEGILDKRITNKTDIWPDIEKDFQFAIDNLPETQEAAGRATKGAAQAYLAKVYLFQQKYSEAKALLDAVINKGIYGLNDCYGDNFDAEKKNSKESLFAQQQSVNDGSSGSDNGGYGEILNYPFFGPFCCGYFQPSQNLVNAFKTDDNGLPLLDSFNDTDIKSDDGVPFDAPFTPYTGNLDPRLDYTVGRRGIPYNGFGPFQGNWVRSPSYGGPYAPKKHVPKASDFGLLTGNSGTSWTNANNYEFIRFSDVLLMRAEIAVEENDLDTALQYINQVRNRAKTGCPVQFEDGTPAANYKIEPYPTFPSQEYARKAVRFERRLELAMEGHRFYDLVRWNTASEVLNAYLEVEKTKRTYLGGASFNKGKDEYLPIPQVQISNSFKDGEPTLNQNPGY